MDELLPEFLAETLEGLAEADRALLHLERAPGDQAILAILFRTIHTIKGSSAFLPLPRLGRLAHAAEDVLAALRDGTLTADPAAVSTVFAAIDRIRMIVEALDSTGAEPVGEDGALIADLGALAEREGAPLPAQAAETPEPAAGRSQAGQTIRVNVSVIETLMALVSELVLTRNQLIQLARGGEDSRFEGALQRLSHLTSDLQEGVMKTRMQPIGHIRDTLSRAVRDLAQELGKRIELVMVGANTDLDRQVLDLMRDPLIHMVRNSADHGLEDTEGRKAAGKPSTGRITLNAYHEGGHVVIEVADDGAGLQTGRIRARAIAQGLATEDELAGMTEAQIQRFILKPGFTTAPRVSIVSGRGVGMDVVRANIERIGGSIALHSVAGRGTTFTIRIPLTLAIIAALIVEARGERFAIPQLSVLELLRLGRGDEAAGRATGPSLETVDGAPMLRLRDNLLPLVHLGDVLRMEGPALDPADMTIVVLSVSSVNTAVLGLVVDRVFDTEEIVVKPVSPLLRHISVFGGKTILGDGAVIMILEPNGVVRALGLGGAAQRQRPAAPAMTETERSGDLSAILLFRPTADAPPAAVPLGLVARIEDMPLDRIETSSGRPITQYRGHLMPLVAVDPAHLSRTGKVPVLVFADRHRSMGLIVHEVLDVVHQKLVIELSAARPGLLGTAVIDGRVTDVIDAGYWLVQAWQDWFLHERSHQTMGKRLLVVEDSAFFRQLLVPMLAAAGYDVTAVDSAARALMLRDEAHVLFDAIISDVGMPDMDGLAFAKRVRESGPWQTTPLLALSGRFTEADAARGRAAGFNEYLRKLDRETLLITLQRYTGATAMLPA